jgi:siroheme synthase-like protein
MLSDFAPLFVFAATNSSEVNRHIAAEARQIGAWVNNASDGKASDFHNLAQVESAPLTIAISTGGTSPALMKMIKQRIAEALGDDLPGLAQWLGELRELTPLPTQHQRQDLYERILQSDVPHLLRSGEAQAARAQFEAIVLEACS